MSRLRRRQVEEFFEIGFCHVRGVFRATEIAEIQAAFDRLYRTALRLNEPCDHRGSRFVVERNGNGLKVQRVVWCGSAEPVLSQYGKDRRLLRMAAVLLGSSRMDQLINQAHFKMPGDGVRFDWHQDSANRRYGGREWRDVNGRGSYVQTVIAVDEVRKDNGPLQFIPGSCKLGHVSRPGTGELPAGAVDEHRAVAPTMKPGDVLLFGPYTLHKSAPNNSSSPRRVFINGFSFPGANSRTYPGQGAGRSLTLGAPGQLAAL